MFYKKDNSEHYHELKKGIKNKFKAFKLIYDSLHNNS